MSRNTYGYEQIEEFAIDLNKSNTELNPCSLSKDCKVNVADGGENVAIKEVRTIDNERQRDPLAFASVSSPIGESSPSDKNIVLKQANEYGRENALSHNGLDNVSDRENRVNDLCSSITSFEIEHKDKVSTLSDENEQLFVSEQNGHQPIPIKHTSCMTGEVSDTGPITVQSQTKTTRNIATMQRQAHFSLDDSSNSLPCTKKLSENKHAGQTLIAVESNVDIEYVVGNGESENHFYPPSPNIDNDEQSVDVSLLADSGKVSEASGATSHPVKPRACSSIRRIQEKLQEDLLPQSKLAQSLRKSRHFEHVPSKPVSTSLNYIRRQRSRSRASKYGRPASSLIQRPYRRWLSVSTNIFSDSRYIVSSKKKANPSALSSLNQSKSTRERQTALKEKIADSTFSDPSTKQKIANSTSSGQQRDRFAELPDDSRPSSSTNTCAVSCVVEESEKQCVTPDLSPASWSAANDSSTGQSDKQQMESKSSSDEKVDQSAGNLNDTLPSTSKDAVSTHCAIEEGELYTEDGSPLDLCPASRPATKTSLTKKRLGKNENECVAVPHYHTNVQILHSEGHVSPEYFDTSSEEEVSFVDDTDITRVKSANIDPQFYPDFNVKILHEKADQWPSHEKPCDSEQGALISTNIVQGNSNQDSQHIDGAYFQNQLSNKNTAHTIEDNTGTSQSKKTGRRRRRHKTKRQHNKLESSQDDDRSAASSSNEKSINSLESPRFPFSFPKDDSFRQDGGLAGSAFSIPEYEFMEPPSPPSLSDEERRGRQRSRSIPFDGTNGKNPLREELKQYLELGLHPSRSNKGQKTSLRRLMKRSLNGENNNMEYYIVEAVQTFEGKLPGQLSFKKGQLIKQMDTGLLPKNGMSYGYYKTGRLRRKKAGLYPCSYVTCQVNEQG